MFMDSGMRVPSCAVRWARTIEMPESFGVLAFAEGLGSKGARGERDVVLLKEAQGRYAERNFEQLYDRWRKGNAKDPDVMRVAVRPLEAARGVFGTLVCGSSLRIFTDPLRITAENSAEPESRDSLSEVSTSASVQVSWW